LHTNGLAVIDLKKFSLAMIDLEHKLKEQSLSINDGDNTQFELVEKALK